MSHVSALRAASTFAAITDRSSAGRIIVTGADRLDLLHRLSTNDLLSLKSGQTRPTVFTTDKGRVIDHVLVCVLNSSLLLLTSPGGGSRLLEWTEKYHIMEDILLSDVTAETSMSTVVGPEALSLTSKLVGTQLSSNSIVQVMRDWGEMTVASIHEFSTSFVYVISDRSNSPRTWSHLLREATDAGVGTMDSQEWDAFRICRGIPVAGHDLTEDFNPYECGLLHAISFTKGCYIGQEVIARLDTYHKVQRELIGLTAKARVDGFSSKVPLYKDGSEIGWLTSLSNVEIAGMYPGLAIVRREIARKGDTLTFEHGIGNVEVSVVDLPMSF